MSRIIRKSERLSHTNHMLNFDRKAEPGSGYSFPCDAAGVLEPLGEIAQESYAYCLAHPEEFDPPHIRTWTNTYRQPAVLLCDCGTEVELYNPLTNSCSGCSLEYNMSGQRLAPRSQWEDRWDEDDPHPYNYQ